MAEVSRRTLANAIRVLSMDAVQAANSGHPGMPMGMADIAQVLWQDFLNHHPKNPNWFNRDRFILSNGHGAMLQYSLLHLTGYDLTIDDLKQFRQYHSKTPGHPERGETPGVETTTGPLGQGLANAVGMALAEKVLANTYNRPNHIIIDHWTYAFVGDGCLMEGISHEACSLAGTLGLGKLIVFYDDNGISIDGAVADWFQDDTVKRFESYGWHVVPAIDGHDFQSIKKAIELARAQQAKPTLICCKTTIGYGAPTLAGSAKTHGAPLGAQEIAGVRSKLGWNEAPFVIPDIIYQAWDASEKGTLLEKEWQKKFQSYEKQFPELAADLTRRIRGQLPEDLPQAFANLLQQAKAHTKELATRRASHLVLSQIGPLCSELLGGSADLTESNLTAWPGVEVIKPQHVVGNYLHYGVREFGMAAIMNGLSAHGGFIPYGGTFLTFLDYARNAVRLAALMKLRTIFVFTHDSIGLGEDGPTHQPIEHITMLRATPNMTTWRPADFTETVIAWENALKNSNGPTSLLLTRQNVPPIARDVSVLKNIEKGGYIVRDCSKEPELILLASGSEVSLCLEAQSYLMQQKFQVRVISVPCLELLRNQDQAYLDNILPQKVKNRIAVEAGSKVFWQGWVGDQGRVLGLEHFGASAPFQVLYKAYGLTVENIVQEAMQLLKQPSIA